MTFRHLRQDGSRRGIARRGDPSVRLDVVTAPRFDQETRIEAVNRNAAGLRKADGHRRTVRRTGADRDGGSCPRRSWRAARTFPSSVSTTSQPPPMRRRASPPSMPRSAICAREIADMLLTIIAEKPGKPLTRLIAADTDCTSEHGPAPRTEADAAMRRISREEDHDESIEDIGSAALALSVAAVRRGSAGAVLVDAGTPGRRDAEDA